MEPDEGIGCFLRQYYKPPMYQNKGGKHPQRQSQDNGCQAKSRGLAPKQGKNKVIGTKENEKIGIHTLVGSMQIRNRKRKCRRQSVEPFQ